MIFNSSLLLSMVTFIFGLAWILYVFAWVFHKENAGKAATWVTIAACVGNTVGILLRWYESYKMGGGYGHAPLSNIYESLVFFAWMIGTISLAVEGHYKSRIVGCFTIPLAFFALAYASFGASAKIQPLIPALKSNWLIAHVITCFIGYAAFAVSSGASILYLVKDKTSYKISPLIKRLLLILSIILWALAIIALIFMTYIILLRLSPKLSGLPGFSIILGSFQAMGTAYAYLYTWVGLPAGASFPNVFAAFLIVCGVICALFYLNINSPIFKRLPELKIVDELAHQLILFGFLFLTAGIISGAVWANSAWGRYWGWDPKETWSLITWFVYATLLHARMMRGWRGKRIAVLTIIGFAAVLFTYFGVNLLPGLHSYGKPMG